MHAGKVIAFGGGILAAALLSGALMGESHGRAGHRLPAFGADGPQAAVRPLVSPLPAVRRIRQVPLDSPLAGIEQASRDLFAALCAGDWPRVQEAMLDERGLQRITWRQIPISALGLPELRHLAFDRLSRQFAQAHDVRFEGVRLGRAPEFRRGQPVAEEVDWLLTLDGEPVALRSEMLVESGGAWRFLAPPLGADFRPRDFEPTGQSQAVRMCGENLKELETALAGWTQENQAQPGTRLPLEALTYPTSHLDHMPVCPAGGIYGSAAGQFILVVGEPPVCTLGGAHTLP